jgi:carboxylesterase type B
VFDTLHTTERPWEDADHRLADAMPSYWANFAATGNPHGAGLPAWPAYDRPDALVMRLGERIEALPLPRPAQMAFCAQEIAEWGLFRYKLLALAHMRS